MSTSISSLRVHVGYVRRFLPLILLFALSACTGLAEEPEIVSTLRPSELTAIAPIPTGTPPVTVSTPVSTPANNPSATPRPTISPTSAQTATQVSTQTVTAPATQNSNDVRGTVSGSVTNGTAGGTVPANLVVMLHITDEQEQENTAETTIDSTGNYTFRDVPIRPDRGYWAMTTYTDRLFGSAYVVGDPTSPSISMPLKIYEVTTNPEVISISSITMRVYVTADGLQIAQIIKFMNKSDHVYTTATALDQSVYGSVALTVPRGASIMGFADDEQRYSISADGVFITDTKPVLPGDNHSIHVIYTLPYRDGITIEQPMNYPVNGNVQLLVSPEMISATSPQLPSLGLQTQEGDAVKIYGGRMSLAAGDVLRYQLTGVVPITSGATAPGGLFSGELMIGMFIGLGLGAVIVGLYFFIRHRPPDNHTSVQDERQPQIDNLIEQLAKLDDLRAKGAITHSAYSRRREHLKERLSKLIKP